MLLYQIQQLYMRFIARYTQSDAAPIPTFTAATQNSADGLSHIHAGNNVMSFFFRTDSASTLSGRSPHCFDDMHYGHRDHPGHDAWHLPSLSDIDLTHHHVIKGESELITPAEFNCLIDGIKQSESKHDICSDRITNCLLNTNEAEKFKKEYRQYYESPAMKDARRDSVQRAKQTGARETAAVASSLLHAFFTTFADHYIVPYLISEKNLSRKNAIFITDRIKLLASILLSFSLLDSFSAFYSSDLLKSSMEAIGIPAFIADAFTTTLATAFLFTREKIDLLQIPLQMQAAAFGHFLARALIASLPKFRLEAAPGEQQADGAVAAPPTPPRRDETTPLILLFSQNIPILTLL